MTGADLRKARIARNLSLRSVADHLGISYARLSEVERGKGREASGLERLAIWTAISELERERR